MVEKIPSHFGATHFGRDLVWPRPTVMAELARILLQRPNFAWTKFGQLRFGGIGVFKMFVCTSFSVENLWVSLLPNHHHHPLLAMSSWIDGSHLIMPSARNFLSRAWDAMVELAKYSPIWPACQIQCTDRSRRSSSETVQKHLGCSYPRAQFCACGEGGQGALTRSVCYRRCGCSWQLWIASPSDFIALADGRQVWRPYLSYRSCRLI